MSAPYIEPVVGERRACRCVACGSCGATFLHDAPIADFTCPTCGLVLCQSCCDAGHGDTGQHGKIDPARVNRDLRATVDALRAERDELARKVESWEAAHVSLRSDVLHNADGYDCDTVNHYLGMIDDSDQRPYAHITGRNAP